MKGNGKAGLADKVSQTVGENIPRVHRNRGGCQAELGHLLHLINIFQNPVKGTEPSTSFFSSVLPTDDTGREFLVHQQQLSW